MCRLAHSRSTEEAGRCAAVTDAAGASTSSSSGLEAEPEEAKRILCGLVAAPNYPTSFWNQLRWLMWRSLLAYLRNPADVAGRLLMYLFVGIMLGLIFLGDRRGEAPSPSDLALRCIRPL